MYFRRTGPLDDRRRRVLSDTMLASALGYAPHARRTRRSNRRQVHVLRSENYGDAEFLEDQLRFIDLIPLRVVPLAGLVAAGLLLVAGLVALHYWMPRFAALTPSGRLAAFDLDGPRCVGAWFSSAVLTLAALAAALVYSIRRYKIDDYHGHYHVWLWAALGWLLMSVEQVAALREAIAELLIAVTGTRLLGDGSAWWIALYGFLIGGVGMRLLIDMRSCLLSTATLLGAAGSYLLALAVHFGWVQAGTGDSPGLLLAGAILLGNLLIFLAMVFHARHVVLDACGLVSRRENPAELLRHGAEIAEAAEILTNCSRSVRRPARSRSRVPASAAAEPPQQVTVVLAQPQQSPRSATVPASVAAAVEPPVGRKLTKEERKRLRERLERERREREALGE